MSRKDKNTCNRLWLAAAFVAALGGVSMPAAAQSPQQMQIALQKAAQKNWAAAVVAAPGSVAQDIIEWQRLRAGEGTLTDYEAFLTRRPDWPGLPLLRQKGEAAVARSTTPSRVLAWFGNRAPATGEGAMALIMALRASGKSDAAEDAAMRAWAELKLSAIEEEALLRIAPQSVPLMHELRVDRLLWDGRRAEALRMLPRLEPDWQALTRARLALRAGDEGVNALISQVPPALAQDPGLAYERFIWRMKRDMYDEALPLILERSASAASLGQPAEWAPRRAVLTRWLMRQNRPSEAYRVAANHHLSRGGAYADLEFLAGFVALRRLNDPAKALTHFKNLEAGVSTGISLSRALYWQGRAYEAQGAQEPATAAYQAAARHQTAYYGLLAAEKLGLPLDGALLAQSRATDWRQGAWTKSSVHQAASLAREAGDLALAKRFWLHLAETQDATALDQMGAMALAKSEPHIAVLLGKAAAERGVILPGAYYPLTELVPDDLSVSRAFALAIARRESEFDPSARSSADARGLMQVLPGTAKMMASKLSLPFEPAQLTRDPGYNAKLGSAYLAHLMEEFGPSIALVASGYNAGPGRPRRWIGDFGDPRQADVDIVDWVEQIPFSETRTYVMRVVEGVVIYRAKLRGSPGPVRVTAELRG